MFIKYSRRMTRIHHRTLRTKAGAPGMFPGYYQSSSLNGDPSKPLCSSLMDLQPVIKGWDSSQASVARLKIPSVSLQCVLTCSQQPGKPGAKQSATSICCLFAQEFRGPHFHQQKWVVVLLPRWIPLEIVGKLAAGKCIIDFPDSSDMSRAILHV